MSSFFGFMIVMVLIVLVIMLVIGFVVAVFKMRAWIEKSTNGLIHEMEK